MFTADSMRGPSLDDTRIFLPALGKQRCKVFFRADPLCPAGISPSMGRRAGAVLAVVAPSHRGEGWGGVCKSTDYDDTDLVINAPSVHIISHYLALSCSISQSANFVAYLCNSERKTGNNPPPPLRSSPLSQGDSQLQPTRGHTYNL